MFIIVVQLFITLFFFSNPKTAYHYRSTIFIDKCLSCQKRHITDTKYYTTLLEYIFIRSDLKCNTLNISKFCDEKDIELGTIKN
jgi:hypothetical protein